MNNKECPVMHSLIQKVKGTSLCLDAGFVDRELTRKISELGIKPFIFSKEKFRFEWQCLLEKYVFRIISQYSRMA